MTSRAPLDLYWYLPTHGDGPYLGTDERHRPASFGYLKEIAQVADRVGFKCVLLPTGTRCEDAWSALESGASPCKRGVARRATRAGVQPGEAAIDVIRGVGNPTIEPSR